MLSSATMRSITTASTPRASRSISAVRLSLNSTTFLSDARKAVAASRASAAEEPACNPTCFPFRLARVE
jgi:hypothetical protein